MLRLKQQKSKPKSQPTTRSKTPLKKTLKTRRVTKRSLSTTTPTPTAPETAQLNAAHPDAPFMSTLPALKPTVAPNNLPPNINPIAARVSTAQPRQIILNLMQWVHTNGGRVSPKAFYGSLGILRDKTSTDTHNWRGLALDDIEAGEVLAEVPLSLCIFPLERSVHHQTLEPVGNSDENFFTGLHSILTAVPPKNWQLRLGVRLLAERAADASHFQPYIDALPAAYPTFPCFFNQKAAQTLNYPPMLVQLNKQSQTLNTLAKSLTLPYKKRINPQTGEEEIDETELDVARMTQLQKSSLMAFSGQEVSIGDLAWAECSVSSRAFDCPLISSAQGTGVDSNMTTVDGIDAQYSYKKCLVPLIDMCNHSFTPNCSVKFRYDGKIPFDANNPECRNGVKAVLQATHPIQRGKELTISYFKAQSEEEKIPLPIVLTPENEHKVAKELMECNDIQQLFKTALCRVPNVAPEGLQSTINNDRLLQHFGFLPGFNYHDDVALNPEISFFDTALEMSHDITIAHSYLAGKLSTSASQKIKLSQPNKNKEEAQLEEQLKKLNKIEIEPDSSVATPSVDELNAANAKTGAISKEEVTGSTTQAMFGEENTFESALVKLLMPTNKQRADDFVFLLHSLFQHNPTLSINWGGPNENLLGICRILAAGCYAGNPALVEKSTGEKSIEQEIVAKQDSENNVAGQIEHNQQELFEQIEKVARAIAVMNGEIIDDQEELSGAQLFRAFQAGPISKENEEGAMLVLYHALVVASAGFRTGVNKDVEGFYKSLVTHQVGDAMAHLYTRSKKMLVTHVMKTLATRLGLDSEQNKTHDWHNRLEKM